MRAGGGLTAVERHGDTVRRVGGEGTPAVHALLRHLHAVGFSAAPRVLGLDAAVEVLSYVAGGGPTHSDDELARVGGLIRALHTATASFVAPPDGPLAVHGRSAARRRGHLSQRPLA